jgi:uncharacterized membrane protein YphA (DoxX/SURF4 family)
LVAGALKAGHPIPLASTIAGFRILPAPAIAPLALFLPYIEIGLGLYLIIGLFTRYAAGLAFLQLLIFAGAIASVVARGIQISCGCFGPADTANATWLDVARDLLLAALTLPLIIAGAGRFAVDNKLGEPKAASSSLTEGTSEFV